MGDLSFSQNKFYFQARTSVGERRARKAGLKYDASILRWVTRNFDKARALRQYANDSAERKLKTHFITDLSTPECISYPDHLSPRTWQVRGAWHLLSRTPSYDADEAGLGKTITAILAINSVPGKTLITCPPYLRFNWENELREWSTSRGSIHVIEDSKISDTSFDHDIIVLPDSLVTNVAIQAKIKSYSFTWLILDEFHRFKTEDAQRTRAVIGDEHHGGIASCSERLVFLSGTPIPNGRPIEIYSSLSVLAPEAIGHRSVEEFGRAFCAAKRVTRYEGKRAITNWDFSGASNLKRLKRELREKLMIRHLKKDCLTELGPKTRQLIFLDTPKEILKLEAKLFPNVSLRELMGDKTKAGDIARYRKQVGVTKLKPAIEYLKDLLESSREKIVVSAYHIEVVEGLHAALSEYHALKIRGGMSARDKANAVACFQKDKMYRVMVGNTMSMGLGNTLTKSPYLISVEPEWSPGVNEQMEDRVHRMSQEKHVFCRYLVLRNSLDERMLRQSLVKENNMQMALN